MVGVLTSVVGVFPLVNKTTNVDTLLCFIASPQIKFNIKQVPMVRVVNLDTQFLVASVKEIREWEVNSYLK